MVYHIRLDILILDLGGKKKKIINRIDVAIPNDNNINITWGEKLQKYQDLAVETKELYHF